MVDECGDEYSGAVGDASIPDVLVVWRKFDPWCDVNVEVFGCCVVLQMCFEE